MPDIDYSGLYLPKLPSFYCPLRNNKGKLFLFLTLNCYYKIMFMHKITQQKSIYIQR